MIPQPGIGHLRASHADRERAIDVLKAAFAEGRLDQDEYTDRVGQVHASRTYAELGALTGDLPAGPLGTLVPAPGPAPAASPLPVPVPAPAQPPARRPSRMSMSPLIIAALVAGLVAPTVAIPVIAVVMCVSVARGGPASERRIRLAIAGVILALLIAALYMR